MTFAPRTNSSQFRPPTEPPKLISSPHWNQVKYDPPHWFQVNLDHHENKSISMLILIQVIFNQHTKMSIWPPAQKQVNFGTHNKNKSIYIPHAKPSLFRPQLWSQLNFDPHSKNRSVLHSPDTKIKLIRIQTPNHVIFDPHTERSQFWSPHWNQVNSDPPHWNHVYIDHPHNKVDFDTNTKTM